MINYETPRKLQEKIYNKTNNAKMKKTRQVMDKCEITENGKNK